MLAIIAAPREAIKAIVDKHETLTNLVSNGWLQLVALDGDRQFRCTEELTWAVMD